MAEYSRVQMMPGQTPYTPEELETLYALVSDAADEDPGEANETYVSRCPCCGEYIDYCQGHGEIGDPAGFAILAAHDDDDHSGCNPAGCDVAAEAPLRWDEGFWDRQANR
jgi:hypothetical protein